MNITSLKKPIFAFAAAVAACIQFASEVRGAMADIQHAADPTHDCHLHHQYEYEHDAYDGEE